MPDKKRWLARGVEPAAVRLCGRAHRREGGFVSTVSRRKGNERAAAKPEGLCSRLLEITIRVDLVSPNANALDLFLAFKCLSGPGGVSGLIPVRACALGRAPLGLILETRVPVDTRH